MTDGSSRGSGPAGPWLWPSPPPAESAGSSSSSSDVCMSSARKTQSQIFYQENSQPRFSWDAGGGDLGRVYSQQQTSLRWTSTLTRLASLAHPRCRPCSPRPWPSQQGTDGWDSGRSLWTCCLQSTHLIYWGLSSGENTSLNCDQNIIHTHVNPVKNKNLKEVFTFTLERKNKQILKHMLAFSMM